MGGSSSGIPGSAASSGSGSSMNSELTTLQTQSFQFSPGGSAASSTIYQWPQNGYYPASDWTASTSTIYTSGTTIPGAPLMAVVTPLPHAQVEDVPTAILTSTATSMPLNRVVYAPTLEPTSEATCKPQKRGRGRPKGSKNKTKKLTMECGSQTVESSLESKM